MSGPTRGVQIKLPFCIERFDGGPGAVFNKHVSDYVSDKGMKAALCVWVEMLFRVE